MKTKSFQKYLEKRLEKKEIADIERQAKLEIQILVNFQKAITGIIDDYVKKNSIGFNELARKLDWSPSKVAKTRRGEANLTLTSLAHLLASLGTDHQEILKSKK